MHDYQILLDTVRQSFASVVWTHKIQEKQADIYSEQYSCMETINIIMASLSSCGIISLISNFDPIIVKILTCVASFATLAITAYFKSFDLKGKERLHKDAANSFIVIRNELIQIIGEIHMHNKEVSSINEEYCKIMDRLNSLYLTAPSASNAAVKRASKALGEDRDYTYSDEEIDRFLPHSLRGRVEID